VSNIAEAFGIESNVLWAIARDCGERILWKFSPFASLFLFKGFGQIDNHATHPQLLQ
jgi:hypothetical protein